MKRREAQEAGSFLIAAPVGGVACPSRIACSLTGLPEVGHVMYYHYHHLFTRCNNFKYFKTL